MITDIEAVADVVGREVGGEPIIKARPGIADRLPIGSHLYYDRGLLLEACAQAMERDRSTLATWITKTRKALMLREWLRLGRGSYEYDDDRFRDEFSEAWDELYECVTTLQEIASNWTNTPLKAEEVERAREELRHQLFEKTELLEAALRTITEQDKTSEILSKDRT